MSGKNNETAKKRGKVIYKKKSKVVQTTKVKMYLRSMIFT